MLNLVFNDEHVEILTKLGMETDIPVLENLTREKEFEDMDNEEQLSVLVICNFLYRAGKRIVKDSVYDPMLKHFATNNPAHPFVITVEPEAEVLGKTVTLPERMLSTDKAYTKDEIRRWLERILKAAKELDIDPDTVELRVTPKLDGFAGYDDGDKLYTRGDGILGQDISRAFERGLMVVNGGPHGLGPGEIVVDKQYFEDNLSDYFDNSRNVQSAVIAPKNCDPKIKQALRDGACVFYPFRLINNWTGLHTEFKERFDEIVPDIWNSTIFDVDGVVIEAIDNRIKDRLGDTRKFHKWQIAFKVNEESAKVEVLDVTPQTSRNGRITPVAELKPTRLSRALISRATVHHYGKVKKEGIGPGAIVEIVRSGLVIPKIEWVIYTVEPKIPTECPSCGSHLVWDNDYLVCPNKLGCKAQLENTLVYFFKTMSNVDGFGPAAIKLLTDSGISSMHEIYALTAQQMKDIGLGDKNSGNLVEQLSRSKQIQIEDWRFLSAFGVSLLGASNSEKLLSYHPLTEIFDLKIEDIEAIHGFGKISGEAIVEGLRNIKDEFNLIYSLGFNIKPTRLISDGPIESPISGASVVFTGTMEHANRDDMKKQARELGAKTPASVTSNTTYLVVGKNVGEKKIKAAEANGTKVLTETEYLELLA